MYTFAAQSMNGFGGSSLSISRSFTPHPCTIIWFHWLIWKRPHGITDISMWCDQNPEHVPHSLTRLTSSGPSMGHTWYLTEAWTFSFQFKKKRQLEGGWIQALNWQCPNECARTISDEKYVTHTWTSELCCVSHLKKNENSFFTYSTSMSLGGNSCTPRC